MKTSVYDRIYDLVRMIPPGKVMTYGQIAKYIDSCNARMVGYAMAALPHNTDVPWYRVINSQGRISLPPESGGGIQCKLLENENIIFEEEGRLDLEKYKWYPYT